MTTDPQTIEMLDLMAKLPEEERTWLIAAMKAMATVEPSDQGMVFDACIRHRRAELQRKIDVIDEWMSS